MLRQFRLLLGVNLLWLALSILSDGINTLVLPNQLSGLVKADHQATILGILSFLGILAGMLIQPLAGRISDQLWMRAGRQRFIGIGVLFTLISLGIFALLPGLTGIVIGYLAIQISASITQAGQQGLLPDQVPDRQRGLASGIKGLLDIGGSMLGFFVLGQLLGSGRSLVALALIGAALVLTYGLATMFVSESPSRSLHGALRSWSQDLSFSQSFSLDPKQHRSLVWLISSRFLFLLATYAIGRFLLLFVSDRLSLGANAAAEQAGNVLAGLALFSVLASLPMGWAVDRFGRIPLMVSGAVLSALGVLLIIRAESMQQMLVFGAFLSIGSGAFASANWAMTADIAPPSESARFFALANFGTAGAMATAGLFGPFIDWINRVRPGTGYPALFSISALVFLCSAIALYGLRRSFKLEGEEALQVDELR